MEALEEGTETSWEIPGAVIIKYEPTNSNEGMLDLNTITDNSKNAKTKMVSCWTCPLCPLIYKRRFNFDQHLTKVHQLQPEEVSSTWKSVLPQSEFALKQTLAKTQSLKKEPADEGSSASSPKKDSTFGPKAFSSSFCCSFCGESFERDSNLLLHLQLQHSGEEEGKYRQALEDVKHYRMDGCSYQCAICQSKESNSNINGFVCFARAVKQPTIFLISGTAALVLVRLPLKRRLALPSLKRSFILFGSCAA